jgi:hypothetical protein
MKDGSVWQPLSTEPFSFVVLSEAEGFAVLGTFRGNAKILPSNRIVISTGAQRSGETCGFPWFFHAL